MGIVVIPDASVKASLFCWSFPKCWVGVMVGEAGGYFKWGLRVWFLAGKFLGRSDESHTGWKSNGLFPIGSALGGAAWKSRFGRGHLGSHSIFGRQVATSLTFLKNCY